MINFKIYYFYCRFYYGHLYAMAFGSMPFHSQALWLAPFWYLVLSTSFRSPAFLIGAFLFSSSWLTIILIGAFLMACQFAHSSVRRLVFRWRLFNLCPSLRKLLTMVLSKTILIVNFYFLLVHLQNVWCVNVPAKLNKLNVFVFF